MCAFDLKCLAAYSASPLYFQTRDTLLHNIKTNSRLWDGVKEADVPKKAKAVTEGLIQRAREDLKAMRDDKTIVDLLENLKHERIRAAVGQYRHHGAHCRS